MYQLLSTVCPHAMGEVVDFGNVFMCPDHGWRFEKSEGICINGPNSRMTSFPGSRGERAAHRHRAGRLG